MDFPPLILKKGEDRRIRAGHSWVFSNEVDTRRTPLDAYAPGQAISIQASGGNILGTGYVNPHSLICARLVSRDPERPFGPELIRQRLKSALSLRQRLFEQPFYRLVYGESDGLPGLIVDRYGGVLVVQINTAGIEAVKNDVLESLLEVLKPEAVLLRNDAPSRTLEGLGAAVDTAFGTVPASVEVPENGCRFEVPLLDSQKTGWYYDHRFNRQRMRHYVRGGRVLDLFSYLGAWGIQAAVAGADHVCGVDASRPALDYLERNANANHVNGKVTVLQGDAFETLSKLRARGETFDVVILDPPAFIKRRKDLREGVFAYQRLNQMAARLLREDGILISASCSYHLQPEVFVDAIRRGVLRRDRGLQIIEQGHQAPDHPIHPAIPETGYLKTYICRITGRM